MEAKKNPEHDVHRRSNQFFLLSLGISIALVIVAFEWTTELMVIDRRPPRHEVADPLVLSYIPITSQAPHLPKPQKNVQVIDLSQIDEATEDQPTKETPEVAELTVPDVSPIELEVPAIEEEVVPILPFRRVENMPEPVGGYEKFYDVLRKNIRYPRVAQRASREGKVEVQFTVNETGALSDFVIIKSLGGGCDEEAIRVIKLTKWNPGKQRGRPVKVFMIQTIFFALQ